MKRFKTIAALAAGAMIMAAPINAQEDEAAAADAAETEAAPDTSVFDGPFAQVQGVWAVTDEACGNAPWQIAGNEFTTGAIGGICAFEPANLTASQNRSQTVTSFTTPATCQFGEDASDWNYAFMLSRTGQTLWVSASNALERTLIRCEDTGGPEAAPAPGE